MRLFFIMILFSGSVFGLTQKVVVSGMDRPWAVVASPDGNIWITEKRTGNIRIYNTSFALQRKIPGTQLPGFSPTGEAGLLDLAFHPNYKQNNWIYVGYSVYDSTGYRIQINRFTYKNGTLQQRKFIFDGPGGTSGNHFGSRLLFDDSGALLVTFGERIEKEKAQDMNQMNGKIVRLTDEGAIPRDNPFGASSPVYSLGHRNPQGLAIHPVSRRLYDSEHGPTVFDAPAGGDEINEVVRGGNYGWPQYHHRMEARGMQAPLLEYTPSIAPSGMSFYTGDKIPNWKNDLFVATLKGSHLLRIRINEKGRVLESEKLLDGTYGRLRDVETSPDGSLLVLSESGKLIQLK